MERFKCPMVSSNSLTWFAKYEHSKHEFREHVVSEELFSIVVQRLTLQTSRESSIRAIKTGCYVAHLLLPVAQRHSKVQHKWHKL